MVIKNQTIKVISTNIFNAKWETMFIHCLENDLNPLMIFDVLSKTPNGFLTPPEKLLKTAIKEVVRVKK